MTVQEPVPSASDAGASPGLRRPPQRRFLRPAACVSLLMLATALAAGCSSSSSTSAASTGANSSSSATSGALSAAQALVATYSVPPTKIYQTVPLPHTPPRGKTFVFLNQGNVPSATQEGQAAEQAAKAIGWKFDELTYDQANGASIQAAFSSALLKHPVAVGIVGTNPSLWGSSVIKEYAAAGVPIIGSSLGPTSSSIVLGVSTAAGNSLPAHVLAAWFAVNSDGKGSALIAHIPAVAVVLDDVVTDFQAGVKEYCPGCHISVSDASFSQFEQGQQDGVVVAALRQNPSINYLFWDDGSFSTGIDSALKAAGLDNIKVAGEEMQPVNADGIRSGTEQAWTAFNIPYGGYTMIDAALRYIEKAPGTANDATIPFELMTKSNIGSSTALSAPGDALAEFEKLWKVSASG